MADDRDLLALFKPGHVAHRDAWEIRGDQRLLSHVDNDHRDVQLFMILSERLALKLFVGLVKKHHLDLGRVHDDMPRRDNHYQVRIAADDDPRPAFITMCRRLRTNFHHAALEGISTDLHYGSMAVGSGAAQADGKGTRRACNRTRSFHRLFLLDELESLEDGPRRGTDQHERLQREEPRLAGIQPLEPGGQTILEEGCR